MLQIYESHAEVCHLLWPHECPVPRVRKHHRESNRLHFLQSTHYAPITVLIRREEISVSTSWDFLEFAEALIGVIVERTTAAQQSMSSMQEEAPQVFFKKRCAPVEKSCLLCPFHVNGLSGKKLILFLDDG